MIRRFMAPAGCALLLRACNQWAAGIQLNVPAEQGQQLLQWIFDNSAQTIFGALLLFVVGISWRRIGQAWTRRRHKKAAAKIKARAERSSDIVLIEYGPLKVDHRSVTRVDETFLLPIPYPTVRNLLESQIISGDVVRSANIFGSDSLSHLGEILCIADLPRKIQPSINAVANQFENRQFGIFANNVLFGVRRIRRPREGINEAPYLELDAFRTDYFTFKVMDHFHRSISASEPEHTLLSLRSLEHFDDKIYNDRLYPYLSSVGLNFLVITKDDKIILTRRSTNLDTFGLNGSPIYPSFNESLAIADIPSAHGFSHPSIPLCFLRGLDEELGIHEDEIEKVTYRMTACGSVGIGFGVYGYAHSKLLAEEIVRRPRGQDRNFESSQVFSIDLSGKAIVHLIERERDIGSQVVTLLLALKTDLRL